jgi:hypothetical protein
MTAIVASEELFNAGSITEGFDQFTPFTFNAAPLQKLLSHLVKQVL